MPVFYSLGILDPVWDVSAVHPYVIHSLMTGLCFVIDYHVKIGVRYLELNFIK